MDEKLKFATLPDEDKLLINGLFERKKETIESREVVRNMISRLKSLEMKMTKEIMSLSTKKIGEKFDIGPTSARPLKKAEIKKIKAEQKPENQKHNPHATQKRIMENINEKKARSENGRKPETHYKSTSKNSWCYSRI